MKRAQFLPLASVALAPFVPSAARASGPKLTVAIIDLDGFQACFAQDLGIFKKYGLDVDLINPRNGPAAIEAAVTGNANIAIANTLSLAQARERGLPLTWIAPGGQTVSDRVTNAVVVAPSSPFKSAKDLTGKTIGTISIQGLLRLVLNAWIDRNGGDSGAVNFVELVPAQVTAALERGTVAAATLTDPQLTVQRPHLRVIGNPFDGLGSPRVVVSAWFAQSDWVTQNQSSATAFANAMGDASVWANDPKNNKQASAIITKYVGVAQDLGLKSYARAFDVIALQPIFDAAVKYKMLPRPITLNELVMEKQ
jgi:NitT/TauT family transport system substrate-binding protein